MAEGTIRVGIGGWTYPPWRGVFYPTSCRNRRSSNMPRAHSPRSRSTRPSTAGKARKAGQTWEKVVPDGFQFAVKGSRFCVTRSRLAEGPRGSAISSLKVFAALGPKLGPILWMRDAGEFDREDIAGFLDLLPREVDGVAPASCDRAPERELPRRAVSSSSAGRADIAIVYDD